MRLNFLKKLYEKIVQHGFDKGGKQVDRVVVKRQTELSSESAVPEEESLSLNVDQELLPVIEQYKGFDKEKIWMFSAGNDGQAFRGNPKYLFVYINKYRPDIRAYWMCAKEETIHQVRELGFKAYFNDSLEAQYLADYTGVIVAEQVKAVIPEGMEGAKFLNLWHGVGFKRIERRLFLGDIALGLAKKYISNGTFFRDHQLLTVTSPLIEKEFKVDLGVDDDHLIRSGYLRCEYQQNYEPVVTFDHDLRKIKGLPKETRMIVFAPTYRAKLGGTFSNAITDIDALYDCCARNNLLLIFKVHPNMENEVGYLNAMEAYSDRKYFWFWDNQDDFYEIMDQMDMAIVDYSSILSDMAAMGIKHFIRYIYDFEEYMQDIDTTGDYFNRTAGKVCRSFEELLDAIDTYQEEDDSDDIRRVNEIFWAYSDGKDDFDKTINHVLDFKIKEREFPNLYSFDIFDTLISRKVLEPKGIFYYVQEKMWEKGGFPLSLTQNYPSVRHTAEFNIREYYRKTVMDRASDRLEITFDEIFDRIAEVYHLSCDQTEYLKKWELEAELDNVIPLNDQVKLVKEFIEKGEKVCLISDMYLSKEFIVKMLKKADPALSGLPLYLSSDCGVQKTTKQLFMEVYKSFEPYYDFKKWIHYGDNRNADYTQPARLGIRARKIERREFSDIQNDLVKELATYDSYLVAALQARMCHENQYERDSFVISFVALCMVPYVDWAIRDSIRRGYKTLYFISRDGHHLKRIADAIIQERQIDIKTKYIYASRRAWRIPSFIDEVDEGFWQPYGNFAGITSKEKLFRAMNVDEQTFREFFPTVNPDNINFIDKEEMKGLVGIFKDSGRYKDYLLKKAKKERELVCGYLEQEINPDEKFAVVEYWGRGYTQDCMVRLWQQIAGKKADVPFYYSRSILPTTGNSVRHNFTTNDGTQIFIESFFANMPYKSIESYKIKEGRIVPVIRPIEYEEELYESMQAILPEFARRYAALDLHYPEDTDRSLYEFALDYQNAHQEDMYFVNNIGTLVDSVALYGKKREFAPPYTMQTLDLFEEKLSGRKDAPVTSNVAMSVLRSDEDVKKRYFDLYQIMEGDKLDGGRVLDETERKNNARFKQKYEALLSRAKLFNETYQKMTESITLSDKIVFVVKGKNIKRTGLVKIAEGLKENDSCEVDVIELGKGIPDMEVARRISDARFILIQKPIDLFCKTHFREHTQLILLNNMAFLLYNKGLAADYFLKWKTKYMQMEGKNDISVIQLPSVSQKDFYMKSYCPKREVRYDLVGCCGTDVYFDDKYIHSSREKLNRIFPEAGNKKVVAYIPSCRDRGELENWSVMLNLSILEKYISSEYVVAVQFNSNQKKKTYRNIVEIPGFCKEIKKELTMKELLSAADVIVGDYRDSFFEAALLHKPMYSTAFDYENIIKVRNMSLNAEIFERHMFCPVISSSEELAKNLQDVEQYDFEPMESFCKEVMEGCDGKSADRVVSYILDNIQHPVKKL